jgi:aspartate/methionine/tyrosine aminotransferase
MPNPFYQIYEGATLLAGAAPEFINILPHDHYRLDPTQLSDAVWAATQLLYVCSPGNPTGAVLGLQDWERLFALSDRHGIVIASDECYSEIYFDESAPPLGSDPGKVPAVSHLSWQRHEPGGTGSQLCRLGRRGPCTRQPPPVSREVRDLHRDSA